MYRPESLAERYQEDRLYWLGMHNTILSTTITLILLFAAVALFLGQSDDLDPDTTIYAIFSGIK